jgi:hypothetical protein
MEEYMFLIPITGEDFYDKLDWIKEEALSTFGGYSIGGPIDGAWLDLGTGEVHEDFSFQFIIALTPALHSVFMALVAQVRILLKQKSMYVRLPNGQVVFVVEDENGTEGSDSTGGGSAQ